MIAIGIIALLLGLGLVVAALVLVKECGFENTAIPLIFGLILMFIGISAIRNYSPSEPEPEAIDVYRGNTELQVNYKIVGNDTIITDSIVVWKSHYQ